MIFALFIIIAIALFSAGVFLFKKADSFLPLVGGGKENERFIQSYGLGFVLLGAVSIITAFLNKRWLAFAFLAVLLFFSAVFSFLLAGKITQGKK